MHRQNGRRVAPAAARELPAAGPLQVVGAEAQRTPVVIVSLLDDHLVSLLEILRRTNSALYWWTSCADAISMLREHPVPVILCDRALPGESWRDLLEQANALPAPPRFIVTARAAGDRFWAEALNLGVYDILTKPYDPADVIRIVGHACWSWRREREARGSNEELAASA